MRWALAFALFLTLPFVSADGITVTAPSGEPVAGTIGVVWHPWVENWDNVYDVYFAQRTYENDTVIGEIRTLVCDDVIGNYCDANTSDFVDGEYVAVVVSGELEGYSNDFQILNHPPRPPIITVLEPTGVEIGNNATISWEASDPDGYLEIFDAFLVKRLIENGEVVGEERTILCTTTYASCGFDTTLFEDGEYAVVVRVSDGQHIVEGYSNTFIILNGPHTRGRNKLPAVVVIEPRGIPLSNLAEASWGSSDPDGDELTFTVHLVSRVLEDGRVIGEAATPLCETTGFKCQFDTTGYANGEYVVTITADDGYGTNIVYSNDFTITNTVPATAGGGEFLEIAEPTVVEYGGRGCCRELYQPIEEEDIELTSDIITSSSELEMQQPPALGFTDIQAPPTHNISSLAPAWSLLIMSGVLLAALLFSTKVTV